VIVYKVGRPDSAFAEATRPSLDYDIIVTILVEG
jgi:hypothetical protein